MRRAIQRFILAVSLSTTWSCAFAQLPAFTTVFTIVMSNHDYAEIVGSANAPYINSLIASYGLATNYMDAGHPALPNYLYMVSGSTQGAAVIDVSPTTSPFPVTAANLGNQLETAGIAWRSYQEGIVGTSCPVVASGQYTPVHDPFLYFSGIQGNSILCVATNRPYSEFAVDLAAGMIRYMWISPNLTNSGHDPTLMPVAALQASDAWLAIEIPKILASTTYKAGGVIFLTWDQAEGRNGNSPDKVPMIIISPKIKSAGFTSSQAHGHADFLATVEDIFGLPRLGAASAVFNMAEFFAVPPMLQSTQSRKAHGAGNFDLPLAP